jgi:DNA-binding NarL/FixJ family response regulator
VVDDQAFWRHGLRQLIDAEPDMSMVAEAGDGREAQHEAQCAQPDVILMDIKMPGMGGVETTRALTRHLPEARIVMLTVSDADEDLFDSLRGGAVGYLLKDLASEELTRAIRGTMKGEAALSPSLARRIVWHLQHPEPDQTAMLTATLTEREEEILRLIARGDRDREIAVALSISESTTKKHVQNILRKLHARNRIEAVRYLRAR